MRYYMILFIKKSRFKKQNLLKRPKNTNQKEPWTNKADQRNLVKKLSKKQS